MNCEDAEASLFEDEPWLKADTTVRTQAESSRGGRAAIAEIDAWQEQHQVLREECENFQSRLLQEAAARVKSAPAVLQVGDFVLAQRGDGRPKIGAAWTGPWLVLDRIDNDPAGVIVQAEHLASKVVRSFHMNMLKMFDISLLDDVADAAPIAALDSWEYEVAEVLEHRTVGGRGKAASTRRLRRKSEAETLNQSSNADAPIKCEQAGDIWETLELSEQVNVKLIEHKF